MATKAKTKAGLAGKANRSAKSLRLKAKPKKAAPKSALRGAVGKMAAKSTGRGSAKRGATAVSPASRAKTREASTTTRGVSARAPTAAKATPSPPQKVRSRNFPNALQAYEAGIKLMHAEEYQKAINCFNDLIEEYSEEPEIQERAKVLIHASEKRLQEKARAVFKSADDHYNIAIAQLNSRELDNAIQHLQQALKLAPKGDHILYALAAANALQGNREAAFTFLKQSIQHRPENRFFAARDDDFRNLSEDPDFIQMVTLPEK
jgi:tetratricopeptide (TPR) repeat protein